MRSKSTIRKYDTCFFERYAQLVLAEFLGDGYAQLVNEDRPDLQSPDGRSMGIEVTRAMEQSKDAARTLLKEMAGVTPMQEDFDDIEQIVRTGYGYGLDNGKYIGSRELSYWSMALPLANILESKVAKVVNGFYGDFDEFGLYVFSKDNLSEAEVIKAYKYVMRLQKYQEQKYSTLYLSEINELHVCNLRDGIKDASRIASFGISQDLRKRFFLDSLEY